MKEEKGVVLFLVLLDSHTDQKALRIKMEGAAMKCKKEMAKMKVVVIKDELEDNVHINEFMIEKLIKWISWMYRIEVELKVLSSPVPILAAAREVKRENCCTVFCSFGKSKVFSLLPKGLRAELPELLEDKKASIIQI